MGISEEKTRETGTKLLEKNSGQKFDKNNSFIHLRMSTNPNELNEIDIYTHHSETNNVKDKENILKTARAKQYLLTSESQYDQQQISNEKSWKPLRILDHTFRMLKEMTVNK